MDVTATLSKLDMASPLHAKVISYLRQRMIQFFDQDEGKVPTFVPITIKESMTVGYFYADLEGIKFALRAIDKNSFYRFGDLESPLLPYRTPEDELKAKIASYLKDWPIQSLKLWNYFPLDYSLADGFYQELDNPTFGGVWVEGEKNYRAIQVEGSSLDDVWEFYLRIKNGELQPQYLEYPQLSSVIEMAAIYAGQTDASREVAYRHLERSMSPETIEQLKQLMSKRIRPEVAQAIYSEALEVGRPDAGWEDEDYIVETD